MTSETIWSPGLPAWQEKLERSVSVGLRSRRTEAEFDIPELRFQSHVGQSQTSPALWECPLDELKHSCDIQHGRRMLTRSLIILSFFSVLSASFLGCGCGGWVWVGLSLGWNGRIAANFGHRHSIEFFVRCILQRFVYSANLQTRQRDHCQQCGTDPESGHDSRFRLAA